MINQKRLDEALLRISSKFGILRRKTELNQQSVAKETGLTSGNIEAARLNINITTPERPCSDYNLTRDEFFDDIEV